MMFLKAFSVMSFVMILTVWGNQRVEYAVVNTNVDVRLAEKGKKAQVFQITKGEIVKLYQKDNQFTLIEYKNGLKGFVDIKYLDFFSKSKTIWFDTATVNGSKDIFDPLVVFGKSSSLNDDIVLERSFRDALRENVDKETVSRTIADASIHYQIQK